MRLISVANLHDNDFYTPIHYLAKTCMLNFHIRFCFAGAQACTRTIYIGISYCKLPLPNCFVLLVLAMDFFPLFFLPFVPKINNKFQKKGKISTVAHLKMLLAVRS